ncbi:MAG TPA: protein kinase [Hyphomicrobiaceae bacterium]|nr:protein kinase [Hyphomicrobiaceae bacterium]
MQPKPASGTNLLALPEGTELVSDYRIKRVLGAGGFGITYLADEIALARLVTIKEYFPADFAARNGNTNVAPRSRDCADDYGWGLDRFIEEAQTLARFVHPNIVRVYRYFRANDTGYMVLHFEEGTSLKSWLRNLKRAPRQRELDQIIVPLLDALEFIHKGNFLHRDIAPDNIIIRADGVPVLIDFGSARGEIASHSKTVSALVKPGYSPFEQYATTASMQGPWTDIYALGATLYHAIVGNRPPDAPSRMVNDEYVPAREAALGAYRKSFLQAIDDALKLEVTERPQSISEWRKQLLMPDPKRDAGRLGLRLPLARTVSRVKTLALPTPAPKKEAKAVAASGPEAVALAPSPDVPPPPDVPQARAQLFDFIEALKKRRAPVPAPKQKSAPSVPPGALRKKRTAPRKKAAAKGGKEPSVPAAQKPSPERAPGGLGYGPQPSSAPPRKPAPPEAKAAEPAAKAPAQPAPKVERRPPPRPRRMRPWYIPSRGVRSNLYKLAIGLGIAALAVAYQDKLPQYEGRGASVVSSQTADLAQPLLLTGHTGPVLAVQSGDQGRWTVSTGSDGTLRVWNAVEGTLLRTIELDEGAATALAVRQRRALTGHAGGQVVLWDIERAEKLKVFQQGSAPVVSLAFLGDGEEFAAADKNGTVAIFDVRGPAAPAASIPQERVTPGPLVVASQARGYIATGGFDRFVRLWEAQTHALIRTYGIRSGELSALDIAPDGRYIAGAGSNGSIWIWSTSSSRTVRALKAPDGGITAIALAPAERLLATADRAGNVRLWNLRNSRNIRTFPAGSGPLQAVTFSADGRRIMAAGQDGAIRVWNVATPVPIN